MRRAVLVLLIAAISWLQPAADVAKAGTLRVSPDEAGETEKVTMLGKTGRLCKKPKGVAIASLPIGSRKAIAPGKVAVASDGSYSLKRRIRKSAVVSRDRTFTIIGVCQTSKGLRRSGTAKLRVLPFSGLPVLPQLLVGFGLVGGGAALLRVDRRRGASGRRRKLSNKPLPISRERMIARRAPKAD
jgi:hypothetical protein